MASQWDILLEDSIMALSCGFYNSLSGDRKYNSVHISEIFDGIINDGIYESIGDWFAVKATTGMNITVGTGRAWFNHTWTKNDALLPLVVSESAAVMDRIDTVVLEVNSNNEIRDNFIKIVSGTPSNIPEPPTLIRSEHVNQYPLADIYVAADTSIISQANITNRVGTSDTPFVTGIIDVMDIDDLIDQWMTQWEQFVDTSSAEYTAWKNSSESDFTTWSTAQKTAFVEWMTESKGDFDDWFDNIQYVLDGDVAGHLQNEIDDHETRITVLEAEPHHIYMSESEYENFDPSQHPNTEVGVYEDPVEEE